MKLSNSNKIALFFSGFTLIISIIFVIIFNYFSFKGWYSEEKKEIEEITLWYELYSKIFDEIFKNKPKIKNSTSFIEEKYFQKEYKKIFWDIYIEDDEFYLVKKIEDDLILQYDISIFVKNQINQLKLSLLLTIFFTILSFILAKLIFSKYILKEIFTLVNKLEKLNISNLNYIKWNFVDNDIKLIVDKINSLLQRIYEHQKDLKYFNSQVSHEFKTPLMIINSELEFLELAWVNQDNLKKIQLQIDKLNNLLNSFILLTKIDTSKINLTSINPDKIINEILENLQKIYKNKQLNLTTNIKKCNLTTNKELFYILVKNLIDNAFKYTDKKWDIKINFDCKNFIITNSIDNKNIDVDKIFNIFYRNQNNKNWFWIGLAIAKKISDTLRYKIKVDTQKNKIIFTIKLAQ